MSALTLTLGGMSATQAATASVGPGDQQESVSIVVIGDSTVCNYPVGSGRSGWGQMLPEFLKPGVEVTNAAKGGLSTKTYPRDRWQELLATHPDYILIQFGHNDSHSKDRPESTDAQTDYKENLRQFVSEAREAGSCPVLVTPPHRRLYRNGHPTQELAPYAEAMKEVAVELDVPLIDLHASSGALYDELGEEQSESFTLNHADKADRKGAEDRTHFTVSGGREMARLVVMEFAQADEDLGECVQINSVSSHIAQ